MSMYVLSEQPKSTQHIYKFACRGKFAKMYMTKEGKDIKERYQWELKKYITKIETGEIEVKLDLYFGDKRKRDVDNFNKLILDAGTGILYADDSQIQKLTIAKHYDKENPRVVINIMGG